MTNIDQSLKDYLLWLNALRGDGSDVIPLGIHSEARFMRSLVREHHEYRTTQSSVSTTENRLEANWQIICERLRETESKRVQEIARSDAVRAANNTHAKFNVFESLHKLGLGSSALTTGIAAIAITALIVLAATWSQWQSNTQSTPSNDTSFGEPQLRGEDLQRFATANPADFADQVTKLLEASNIKVRRVDLIDGQGKPTGAIQLQAKVEPDSALAPQLLKLGLSVPKTGRLDLTIVPKK